MEWEEGHFHLHVNKASNLPRGLYAQLNHIDPQEVHPNYRLKLETSSMLWEMVNHVLAPVEAMSMNYGMMLIIHSREQEVSSLRRVSRYWEGTRRRTKLRLLLVSVDLYHHLYTLVCSNHLRLRTLYPQVVCPIQQGHLQHPHLKQQASRIVPYLQHHNNNSHNKLPNHAINHHRYMESCSMISERKEQTNWMRNAENPLLSSPRVTMNGSLQSRSVDLVVLVLSQSALSR